MTRPKTTEAAPYYFKYIDLVTGDEIVPAIKSQMGETLEFLQGISEEQSLHAYAPGKWTIREVLNHVNDGERLFHGQGRCLHNRGPRGASHASSEGKVRGLKSVLFYPPFWV